MRVLLDTNVLYNYLYRTELTPKAKDVLSKDYEFYVSGKVLNELSYAIIRKTAEVAFGARSYYRVKEILRERGYKPFEEPLSRMEFVLQALGIERIPDSGDWEAIRGFMRKYSLLPNDATILATAVERGIDAIATFDRDYSKVQEVKVLP
ncbi:PIN domain-containing protein [Thermococcus sp. 21S7]|uniref:PIN domain-containing protein n=1 Tax=Thermococcus sp. 21S7 TaxID=1638221 RepID=UPI00143C7321|nr:PIN domain-containing protein [Thermococcus sp. 21S7]NJE62367.1 PIN domain-containing protein [Thermococcus sp. 21S7]